MRQFTVVKTKVSLSPSKKLKVLLADDHELVRQGLRTLIERTAGFKVCGEAATGLQAVAEARRLNPDIVVVDLDMPGLNGLEVTLRIKRQLPDCEILIFTGSAESDELIRDVFASGAKSYIMKTEAGKFLMDALASLAQHKPFFTDKASAVMFARFISPQKNPAPDGAASDERLSPSEVLVVRLLANGGSNATVARKQHVSVRTVENMRAGIMSKLQLKSFADLVRYAVRNAIIKI
ncbi:MAG: DNA-binding response regulator [Verrucomicrobiales bacterium]|nr:DNA-binding response regulator [Verrucomicrobiales bacterium]